MKKVILFNGPPRCGKDTVCNYLKEKLGNRACIVGFKDSLIELTARFYGLTVDAFLLEYDKKFNSGFWCKDMPRSFLGGKSQRQVLIHVSENVVKPVFGDSVFGDALVHAIEIDSDYDVFLVPDSGFEAELEPLTDKFDVTIIRIERDGCTFDGDSRSYLEGMDYMINNSYSIDTLKLEMDNILDAEGLLC